MVNEISPQSLPFHDWMAELDQVAVAKFGYGDAPSLVTGGQCWFDYYQAGYTPERAIEEDESYGK